MSWLITEYVKPPEGKVAKSRCCNAEVRPSQGYGLGCYYNTCERCSKYCHTWIADAPPPPKKAETREDPQDEGYYTRECLCHLHGVTCDYCNEKLRDDE